MTPKCRICGEAATVPPAAYFFCCARTPAFRRGRWRAQPSATKERYGCGPPLAGAHRPDCPVSPDCLFCGYTATVPPAARPHKLQATLRSAYVRLSQSRGAKLALLEPHAIPRPAASGRSRPFRCSSSPNCKRFAGLQFGSVCLARKSGQKEALRCRLDCTASHRMSP